MKNFRSLLIVPAVLLLVSLAAVPATADHGSDSNTATTTSTSGSSDSLTSGGSDTSGGSSDTATGTSSDKNSSTGDNSTSASADGSSAVSETEKQAAEDNFSKEGEARVSALLNDHAQQHSKNQRTKNCQAAKNGLQTKLTNLQKNAAAHKAFIDSVYSQALAYQQQNNLNPTGFSALVSAANAAQAKAAVSVAALNGLLVNLDCSSGSVAQNVATFQAAAQQARNDLLTYRNAVQAVLQALQT